MHEYVHRHCSIDYFVKLILVDENLCKIAFISHWNDFCLIPLGKCTSWGQLQIDAKYSKFWHFWEPPLYEIWEYAFNILFSCSVGLKNLKKKRRKEKKRNKLLLIFVCMVLFRDGQMHILLPLLGLQSPPALAETTLFTGHLFWRPTQKAIPYRKFSLTTDIERRF